MIPQPDWAVVGTNDGGYGIGRHTVRKNREAGCGGRRTGDRRACASHWRSYEPVIREEVEERLLQALKV